MPAGAFESVGLNWLLHCLPGTMATKGVVFDHCKTVLAPGGVVFGSTVLSGGVRHTPMSRWMMDQLNRDGTFTNRDDDLDGLKTQLDQRFAARRSSGRFGGHLLRPHLTRLLVRRRARGTAFT